MEAQTTDTHSSYAVQGLKTLVVILGNSIDLYNRNRRLK